MNGFKGAGFQGNVGADPEVDMARGVANIRVAVKMGTKKDDEETEWVGLSVWGKNFDWFQQNCRKGCQVVIMSAQVTTRQSGDKKFVNASCNLGDIKVIPKAGAAQSDTDLPF